MWIAGQASWKTFQMIRPTRTVTPSAAAPATDLQRNVAEANPPPREGAAGCFRRQFGRGHSGPYEWIFAIVFSATTSTLFGIGTKRSLGP